MFNFRVDSPADGPINMEEDLKLLLQAEEGTISCRIYGWDSVWVTLGSAQRAEDVFVPGGEVPHVHRPTGGAAVLHGHDLTVGLAMPLRRGVRDSYRVVTEPLIRALNEAGIDAALAEDIGADRGDPRRIDCFAGSSANDIVHRGTGEKVCGCALRRSRSAVLVQASIPVRRPVVEPSAVLVGGVPVTPVGLDEMRFIRSLEERLRGVTLD